MAVKGLKEQIFQNKRYIIHSHQTTTEVEIKLTKTKIWNDKIIVIVLAGHKLDVNLQLLNKKQQTKIMTSKWRAGHDKYLMTAKLLSTYITLTQLNEII